MKSRRNALISKGLATIWLIAFFSFLTLNSTEGLFQVPKKAEKQQSETTLVLAIAHGTQVADVSPDLKFLQDCVVHPILSFVSSTEEIFKCTRLVYAALKVELIRILRSCISINAP